jgi:hypothetical protein
MNLTSSRFFLLRLTDDLAGHAADYTTRSTAR